MAKKKKSLYERRLKDVNKDGKRDFGDTWLGDLIGADGKIGIGKGRPGLKDSLKGGIAVRVVEAATAELYRSADWAWIASGTANLEAAWCGLPAAVFYQASPLTWEIGSRIVPSAAASAAGAVATIRGA